MRLLSPLLYLENSFQITVRRVFLWAIKAYWLIPGSFHDKCIFRESCSHYVYRITNEKGIKAGICALKERNKQCRPGYILYRYNGRIYLKTAEGEIYPEEQIALSLLRSSKEPLIDFDDPNKMSKFLRPGSIK